MSAAIASAPSRKGAAPVTGWRNVVAGGALRGLTFACEAKVTFLVDADATFARVRAGAVALRLLAGIGRPLSGAVRALGADPTRDAALRRDVALLGDDVLLDRSIPLEHAARAIAQVRGVAGFEALDANRPRALSCSNEPAVARRDIADRLAAPARARLLLVSYPEQYLDPVARDAIASHVRAAIARGVPVVIATSRLDEWLSVAPDESSAIAAVLVSGVVLVSAPAHVLPWAIPLDGIATRLVRVVLDADPSPLPAAVVESAPRPEAQSNVAASATDPPIASDATVDANADPSPSLPPSSPVARLAADLLADPTVAAAIASIEPVSPTELRLHTRDPRGLSRAIAARAQRGLPVRQLVVEGASAAAIAGAYAGAWR